MKKFLIVSVLWIAFSACNEKIEPMEEFRWVSFGEIKPEGWIKDQMDHDLKDGFVGHLDALVPDLIKDDDIYGADRLTKIVKKKDVGAQTNDAEWEVQYLWWNSETQSNWWDGFIRHAILTGDEKSLQKAEKYVADKLSTQDDDGYIGIYAEDLRYDHHTENGELWAQASLFRGLLAWYEYSNDKNVLEAVEKAVQLTMKKYPINAATPFNIEKPFAGVGHGLMFTDVLDKLTEITGNKDYLDYAVFLYQDYNKYPLSEVDIHINNLMNPDYRFKGHGVHTYEHVRSLALAAFYSKDSLYQEALQHYLEKLSKVITPSGGPIGDEWVAKRFAHADSTGYEYCSIHELLDSYSVLLQKSKNPVFADRMEHLLFNAGQGARHPEEPSLAYCKTDNCNHMMGSLDLKSAGKADHTRFKYSPVHQDVAVCCVPNAGRIYPYYIKAMWMRSENGLVANLFGPSELSTKVDGIPVKIRQKTNYPFDMKIEFEIESAQANRFEIVLRKADWMTNYSIHTTARIHENEDYIILTKEWRSGDKVSIEFQTEPLAKKDLNDETYFTYGPLVFAMPLESEAIVSKTFPLEGFRDLKYKVAKADEYHIRNIEKLAVEHKESENIWESVQMKVIVDLDNGSQKTLYLNPMGGTVLRKVTF